MQTDSIIIEKSPIWKDYDLLDSGNSRRLERYGKYVISRPDPQAIWLPQLPKQTWKGAHANFERPENAREKWVVRSPMPDKWTIGYNGLTFWASLTPFKHTGVFPEQSAQWDWMENKINDNKTHDNDKIKILNLFGYTGIASLVCARSGAHVTHVDASKPAITWARANQIASKLEDKPIRWILDDALKFCKREVRRGKSYHGIIMDPPIYGHGPSGERWDFQDHFPELLRTCRQLLDNSPLFLIINAYAISASSLMLRNVIEDNFKSLKGTIDAGELILQEKNNGRLLSTGIFGRWSREE